MDVGVGVNTDRSKCVCFTGHRHIAKDAMAELSARLYCTVTELILEGCDTFICGGAVGFDTEAAECVLQLKERFTDVRLILALPCRDQTVKWNDIEDLARYKRILGMSDGVFYVTDFYTPDCMHRRNRWMADNSSVCVAYCDGRRGGSAYTVKYAAAKGLRIMNLAEGGGLPGQCGIDFD